MANQKNTDLRRISSADISPGSLFSLVDVTSYVSPTGENVVVTADELAQYIASTGKIVPSLVSAAPTNGLSFDQNFTPSAVLNDYCQTEFPSLGSGDFSIVARLYCPSTYPTRERALVGVSAVPGSTVASANAAYIGTEGYDLVGYCQPNGNTYPRRIRAVGFMSSSFDRSLHVILSRTSAGQLSLWVNGSEVSTIIDIGGQLPTGPVNNLYFTIGNGTTYANSNVTVFEASVQSTAVTTAAQAKELFYKGQSVNNANLLGFWSSETLNQSPSQWLDVSGKEHHLLLPVSGASATNPKKTFSLRFTTSTSGYLGGTARDVLPAKYVLTSCVVESPNKPLLSIGSAPSSPPISASITGSWNDNRVSMVSASYGVNPLTILTLGDVHVDRSIYVQFYSGSATACTFSFEGYTR